MKLNFEKMANDADKALTKNALSIGEGETLIAIVPYLHNGNCGGELPWLECATKGYPDEVFKRSLVDTSPSSRIYHNPAFHAALKAANKRLPLGDDKQPVDYLAAVDSALTPAQAKKAKSGDMYLYVVLAIATRQKEGGTWSFNYKKPQIMTAKFGGKQRHIHDQILRFVKDDKTAQKMFVDLDQSDPKVQLVIIKRTGKGQTDTQYDLSLCPKDQKIVDFQVDGKEIGSFDGGAFALTTVMVADSKRAIADGGDCDLFGYLAGPFSPGNDELDDLIKFGGGSTSNNKQMSSEEAEERIKAAREAGQKRKPS